MRANEYSPGLSRPFGLRIKVEGLPTTPFSNPESGSCPELGSKQRRIMRASTKAITVWRRLTDIMPQPGRLKIITGSAAWMTARGYFVVRKVPGFGFRDCVGCATGCGWRFGVNLVGLGFGESC